ncbi:alpha/beta hydrolase [Agrobacterium rosae]|uniref:alpha/beta hydrolase n=1 Tax=Agrobacterium rosae TaxID=1972867 RepID=UPI003A7FFB89
MLASIILMIGCVVRPDAGVLKPRKLSQHSGERIQIISATNRSFDPKTSEFGVNSELTNRFESYKLSVPKVRDGTTIRYPTSQPDELRQYILTSRKAISGDDMVQKIISAPGFDGTVGVFIHGYNYSHQEALFRTAQVAADAKLDVPPVLFSWPSEAAYTGYVADRDAVLSSRSQLVSVIALLARSPKVRRVVLFGHSLGGFLTMEAVRQIKLQGRDNVVQKLIVILAAPDIDADVFKNQFSDIGKLETPITLLVSRTDRALSVSSFIAKERVRVGQIDVRASDIREIASREKLRVVDISSLSSHDGMGHDKFASFAKYGAQLTSLEKRRGSRAHEIGAFVFEEKVGSSASPFRAAGDMLYPN